MIRNAVRWGLSVLLLSFTAAPALAQTGVSANLVQGLAKGIGGAVGNQLTGYALSAIGISGQGSGTSEIADQLNLISTQLTAIATELTTIASDITTETCSENLNSAALVDARVSAWWLMPVAVALILCSSVRRAVRTDRERR